MNALVFGSTGLIGRHLVSELIINGYSVIGTSRDLENPFIKEKKYSHIKVDVTNSKDFSYLPSKFDLVFNASGYVPKSNTVEESQKCININAIGVLNILEYMVYRKIKRLIHSSSVTVYGIPEQIYATEETTFAPVHAYGVSKVAAENFCTMYQKLYGLDVTMLRYSPIYGEGLRQNTALTIFVKKALKNENITLFQKGKRFQDYVYVKDAVQANILAAQKNINGCFNIASGEVASMDKLARTIVKTFKSKSQIGFDRTQSEEFSIGIDIQKAKRLLGYSPKYNIQKGLQEYKKISLIAKEQMEI